MGIRLGHGTYSEFGSGENYFETILKKLDERRNEIQNTIDEYFSEAEKKANELKQISGIVNQNKNAAAAAASSSYENLKECGNRVNICTSLTLEGKNYAQIVQKSFEDISEVFEIIKKIQQNVENLELNARAYANLAENNAALCKNLDDSTGRSAYKSECFASASEEAYEKARVIRERCEQIFSDIREYEKIIKNAKDYISGEITIKSISANGSAIVPDENKNVDIDIKSVVKQSYLFGAGAPTTSTAAEFVGQLYSDTQNIKLYQCIGITESDDGTKTYEWIKVIRGNDIVNSPFTKGIVEVDTWFGISFTSALVNGTHHEGILRTFAASQSDINGKTQGYKPIVPANLDYAVRSVRPAASDTAPTTLAVNMVYSINHSTDTTLNITLPQGQVGDFVQYDFVTGTTVPTVTIQSAYGMTKFDFTPEANKIYSLFFDWGIIGNDTTENKYGWRISFAEYSRVVIFPEEDL